MNPASHTTEWGKERSIEEVAGCRAMLELIYAQGKNLAPHTEATIRGLHKELLQDRFIQRLGRSAAVRYQLIF